MTLPAISPVVLFTAVIGVIYTLQYFDQAAVAGSAASEQATAGEGISTSFGYPEGSTFTYPLWLYPVGFRYNAFGYANALAVLLFVVAFAVTLVLLRRARGRWRQRHDGPPGEGSRYRAAGIDAAPAAVAAAGSPSTASRSSCRSCSSPRSCSCCCLADDRLAGADRRLLAARLAPGQLRAGPTDTPIPRYLLNTVLYAVGSTAFMLVSSVPAAYALSKMRWRGRNFVFIVIICMMMLPPQVITVPLYLMWAQVAPGRHARPLILPALFGDAF